MHIVERRVTRQKWSADNMEWSAHSAVNRVGCHIAEGDDLVTVTVAVLSTGITATYRDVPFDAIRKANDCPFTDTSASCSRCSRIALTYRDPGSLMHT